MASLASSLGGLFGIGPGGPKAPEGQFGYNTNATGAATGSNFATDAVKNNSILSGGLSGMESQLGTGQGLQAQEQGQLSGLENQGFQLTPEDRTLYGQESGDIARQYGQQENQTANELAQRGLSDSGAAGAAFSGLSGSKNEMLGKAQQQIAQQRFQNTMQRIGQTQQMVGQLNAQNQAGAGAVAGQGASDINQQFGRQLSGEQLQQQNNNMQNQYGLQKSEFDASNEPQNLFDIAGGALAGAGGAAGKQIGQSGGSKAAAGLFGA